MRVEQWRPIPGWPGYEVSDHGRVISRRRARPVVLKPWVTPKAYRFVRLCKGGESKSKAVHRLVMLAFVGPRPDGQEARHRDGDTANNALSNLTYGTHAENVWDTIAHGRHHQLVKANCPRNHPYDEANTRITRGQRYCRPCRREHQARYRTEARGQR